MCPCILYLKNGDFTKNLQIKCCQIWAVVLGHHPASHIWISSQPLPQALFKGQRTSLQPHQGAGLGLTTGIPNQTKIPIPSQIPGKTTINSTRLLPSPHPTRSWAPLGTSGLLPAPPALQPRSELLTELINQVWDK